ncbi:MAG: hypothetical protein ACR2GY_10165 [Phycisphaerales bacterium]
MINTALIFSPRGSNARPRLLATALLTAVGVMLTTALPAAAQNQQGDAIQIRTSFAGPGSGLDFKPTMSIHDFRAHGRVLGLDQNQKLLAEALIDEYQDAFDTKARAIDEAMKELGEEAEASGNFRIYGQKMPDITSRWNRERKELDTRLMDDLRTLLHEDQVEAWPIFERERRRADLLPDSRLGGENVDVIDLVHAQTKDETFLTSLEELFTRYAEQMDAALETRERALEPMQEEWRRVMWQDRERAAAIWSDATAKRRVVRDINKRFVAEFAGEFLQTLGEAEAAAFEAAWEERAYPLAYELTKAERILESRETWDSLTSEQMLQIDELETDLESRIVELRKRLIRAIIKEEEGPPPFMQTVQFTGGGADVLMVTATIGNDEESERYDGLLSERYEASKASLERLKLILTSEQWESLPPVETGMTSNLLSKLRFNL